MSILVFYHSRCFDGTMAAAGAMRGISTTYPDRPVDARFLPISYRDQEGEEFFRKRGIYDKNRGPSADLVVFLDFCPKPEVVRTLVGYGHSVTVLDHHKTALAQSSQILEEFKDNPNVTMHFDMSKSGARLAWEFFVGEVPLLAQYVEDRDLWKWEMQGTKEVMAYLSTFGKMNDPELYLHLVEKMDSCSEEIIEIGRALVLSMNAQVEATAERFRYFEIEGHGKGVLVNASFYPSEVGAYLCEKYKVPFALVYSVTKDGNVACSFRSKSGEEYSVDVSDIAKDFDGGGHANAAGGCMSIEALAEYLLGSTLIQ